ncbi:MAG: hemerythrin domain-containing protein [Pseudomonadota bacterium]
MTQLSINTREGLPTEMQTLLRDYPRDSWPGHPDFAASIQNWMGAHQMFRQLAGIIREDTELFVDNSLDREAYVTRLGRFGNLLVRNLHGHHSWEDHSFFPELSQADPRFDAGLDMLETDHQDLDTLLDGFTTHGNRAIQLHHLDPVQMHDSAHTVLELTGEIDRFLNRHLADEEDLAVPILLHYKLRG